MDDQPQKTPFSEGKSPADDAADLSQTPPSTTSLVPTIEPEQAAPVEDVQTVEPVLSAVPQEQEDVQQTVQGSILLYPSPGLVSENHESTMVEEEETPEDTEQSVDASVLPIEASISREESPASNESPESAGSPESLDVSPEPASEDYSALSSFYRIEEPTLHSLEPALFQALLSGFGEYQSLKSTSQILEVNLEQLKHSAQSKIVSVTTELHTAQEKIRHLDKDSLESSGDKLKYQQKLAKAHEEMLKAQNIVSDLKQQIQQYSEEKKNAFEMLSNKQEQLVGSTQEIKALAESNKQLRNQMSASETGKEELRSQVMTELLAKTKYQRELTLANQSSSWYENELSKKTSELQRLREEKRTEVTDLRSRLDKAEQHSSVVTKSKETLSKSLKDLQVKFDNSLVKIKELSDKVSNQEHEYTEELSKKEQMLIILQNSSDDRKNRIDSLQKMYDETSQKVASDEASYKAQFEGLQADITKRESKIKDLEETVNDLTSANINSGVDTSNILLGLNDGGGVSGADRSVTLTPSAQKVLRATDYSLTDLVAEINQLRKALYREKRGRQKAEEELTTIFKELDRRMPLLKSYKEKCLSLEMKHGQFELMLDNLSKEKSMFRTQLSISSKKAEELQQQVVQLTQYKTDLQRQLATLLAEVTVKEQGDGSSLTKEEKAYIGKLVAHEPELEDLTDTGKLISERLTTFKDIEDLIERNEQLLVVSRDLGTELERRESSGSAELGEAENEALEKSKDAILKLKEQLQNTKTQLEAVTNNRDMLQKLVENGQVAPGNENNSADGKALNERISRLVEQLRQKQQEYNDLKRQYDTKTFELNMKVQSLISEKSDVSLELAKANSSINLIRERAKSSGYLSEATKAENEQLKKTSVRLQDRQSKLEMRVQQLDDALLESRSMQATLEVQVKSLSAEKVMWKNNDDRLREEMEKLSSEKSKANSLTVKLQILDAERQSQFKGTLERLNNNIDRLQKQLDDVRAKLEASNEETKRILHSKNADARSYQARIDGLSEELKSAQEALLNKSHSVVEIGDHLEQLQKKYDSLNSKRTSGLVSLGADTSDDAVAALRQELNRALEDSKLASQNAVQYKQIATASEKELNILNDTYSRYKVSTELRIAQGKEETSELQAQLEELSNAKSLLEERFQALSKQYSEEKNIADAKITELNAAVNAFDSIKADYEARIGSLNDDITSRAELLKRSEEKLKEKDVSVSEISSENEELKRQIISLQEKISQLDMDMKAAQSELETFTESWKSEKSNLEEQSRRDKMRVSEMDTQNRTLMNQLESSQFSFGDSNGLESDKDMKSLLGYLHRENDSLSQQLEYSKSEEKKLRQSVSMNEKELSEVKIQLEEAKQRSLVADKYTTLLEKMKQESQELSVYKENNQSLRDEVRSYSEKVQRLENEYNLTVSKIEPLQQQVAQLQSEAEARNKQLEIAQSELNAMKTQLESKGGEKDENKKAEDEEKKALVLRVADLERQKSSATRNEEQLKLYQTETLRLNNEVKSLKARIASLNEETEQKIEEIKKSAGKSEGPADKAREEFRKKVHVQEMEVYKRKLQQETDAYKNQVALESEVFKKNIEAESKTRLQQEMEAYKKRVRAPSNARISEVIEQRWKARSAELDAQYEAKVKEVEANNRESVGSGGITDDERKKMREELEKEKESVREEVTTSVRKETQFRENILKRQLMALKQKVKELEGTPSTADMSTTSAIVSATAPEVVPIVFPATAPASLPSAPFSVPSAPASLPATPAPTTTPASKRPAESSSGNDDKRTKTE
ncbi:hypothetical protein FOA43_004501 [Brettanomyces nanus]|uniref:Nucleoprotein TPR/MLP1 domain-containing protein n=1 Tax=Eeniella nana TaxID=13502 RepID=A0A875S838_EENNA|nr:uncharacterized protein FOA43_004501 [Brettanomyces nanus]QPG77098.1 hypothetical protein FOA43_004501 [Brettanomyces nanus]